MRRSFAFDFETSAVVDPRPIALGDGDDAVLLLHGLTGTPHELRPIAQALHRAGFSAHVPLLAGHTDLDALERSTWRDWYMSAVDAFDALRARQPRSITVLGFSMGALLALRLCALRASEVDAAITVSVPLELPGWKRNAIVALARLRNQAVFRDLIGILPKRGGPDVRIAREADQSPSLSGFPYPALAELVALQDEVEDLLPHVRAPLLVLHGELDHTAPVEGSRRVAQRVGSPRVDLRIMPRSFHLLAIDLDRERVCDDVLSFASSVLRREHHPTKPTP